MSEVIEGQEATAEVTAQVPENEAPVEQEGDYEASFAEFSEKRDKGEPINPEPPPPPEKAEQPKVEVQGDPELATFRAAHPEFAEVPAPLLESIKKLEDHARLMEQKATSATGRLMPMQKKVNELIRQNNMIKAQEQAMRVQGGDHESWTKFKKEYPDIAKAVEARYGSAATPMPAVENISQRISRLEQEENKRRREAEYAALREAHADFVEIVNGPKFQTWLFNQPEPVQALIGSKRAADAAWLISTFKEHAGLTKSAPQATEGKVVDVAAIRQRRERQLVSGRTVESKTVGHAVTDKAVGGFEDAFRHFSAQKDQQRAARGGRYF